MLNFQTREACDRGWSHVVDASRGRGLLIDDEHDLRVETMRASERATKRNK